MSGMAGPIRSGRPPPEETAKIAALIQGLSDAADEPAIHDRLGYGGFVLTFSDGQP